MNKKIKRVHLEKILSNHFVKFSLIPILIVEVSLLILYFSINSYISSKNTKLLLSEAQSHSQAILENEANFISEKLNEVSRMASFLQNEHQSIFANPQRFGLPNGEPSFETASNGVYYKTNQIGASLYYSSKTPMSKETINKARFTEAMDISLQNTVDTNPNIVAAYFNSGDNMNRLYPFIDKVYEQYGTHIQMEDYNFYYLADAKHNPSKKPVWTGAYLDPAGNGWMLSCIVPIYNKGFLEGVTGLDITIDNFVKNILNRKLPYDANLFMVDKEGMIIAMPEKIENLLGLKELKEYLYTDSILKTITKPEEFNILKNKSPFASHFKSLIENDSKYSTLKIGNNEYLTLEQNVKETNWKLMILIDKNNIFSSINFLQDLSTKIGYIAIGFLIIFYGLFFYFLLRKINIFSHTITQPIIDLSKQTSQITQTNTQINQLDTNVSEIYQLSTNFVTMIEELNNRTQKLYDAKIFAEEANKAKDDFLANMSHELKTPLNSINVISSIMMKNKSENLNETQIHNLEIVNKCGKDLLFLINDILDLSKLEAGKMSLNIETLDTKKLMTDIFEMFDAQVKSKNNIDFIFQMDDTIDTIFSDEERIKQIIKNLLSNALKFTHKGKIEFLIIDENQNIKVIIKDEGIGIPSDKLNYIFDRFKQVDGSTTRKYGGTGLGLAICKELSLLLNITLNVESQLDKGSTFELIIQKKQEFTNNLEIRREKEKEISYIIEDNISNTTTKDINTIKEIILILNNDPITFLNIIIVLNKKYNVIQAKNLADLIKLKQEHLTSKILVDLTKLSDEEKNKINENFDNNIILLHKEDLISNVEISIKNKSLLSLKKPLNQKEILDI